MPWHSEWDKVLKSFFFFAKGKLITKTYMSQNKLQFFLNWKSVHNLLCTVKAIACTTCNVQPVMDIVNWYWYLPGHSASVFCFKGLQYTYVIAFFLCWCPQYLQECEDIFISGCSNSSVSIIKVQIKLNTVLRWRQCNS